MEHIYGLGTVYMAFAVISAVIAYHLRISIAVVEMIVAACIANLSIYFTGLNIFEPSSEWVKILASFASVLLTFLAGSEIDSKVIKEKYIESFLVGFTGFLSSFLVAFLISKYIMGFDLKASILSGIIITTTSIAVLYSVMIETGLNSTKYGKAIIASSFVNDMIAVFLLAVIFSPLTYRSFIFIFLTALAFYLFPKATDYLTSIYGNRTAAIRVKFVMFMVLFLGFLSLRAGSEAVVPAYIAGMALSEFSTRNKSWIMRMRTLTIGFLTPFYFLRTGSLISFKSVYVYAGFIALLVVSKILFKVPALYSVISIFRKDKKEKFFYSFIMTAGLTFGTIFSVFGYEKGIIDSNQYSILTTSVILTAIIPTVIATAFFKPKHLISENKKITDIKEELAED